MLFRLGLLLAIAGGLGILVWSNLEPIALVFLGIQTPALPLAVWVVGAIGAGVATHVVVNILFQLSNYATGRQVRFQVRRAARFQNTQREPFQPDPATTAARDYTRRTGKSGDDADWQNWEGFEAPNKRSSSTSQTNTAREPVDDWEIPFNDDWEDTGTRSSTASDRRRYEAEPSPKSASRSGSNDGDSDRPSTNADTARREKVVDADYRVIIPPYYPPQDSPSQPEPTPAPAAEENADDWFEDDSPSDPGARPRE